MRAVEFGWLVDDSGECTFLNDWHAEKCSCESPERLIRVAARAHRVHPHGAPRWDPAGENYWYQKTNVWENPRLTKFVPPFVLDPRSRRRVMVPDDEFNHFNEAKVAAALSHAGVVVNTGAHGQREGLGLHWELAMLVQGGLTPHEALRCETANGAHTLGMDRDIGTLEAGKLADITVIDGNSSPRHPPVRKSHLDDGQRPPLRGRDPERERGHGKRSAPNTGGNNVASAE